MAKRQQDQQVMGIRCLPEPCTMWLKHLRRRNRSERTITTYADNLTGFCRYLETEDMTLLHVTSDDLQAFVVWLKCERGLSASSIERYVAVLKGLYGWLTKQKQILTDPSTVLRSPKVPHRIHRDILTPAQIGKPIQLPDESPRSLRNCLMVRLMVLSGLRISGIISLDVDQVDVRERELRIRGKGGKEHLAFIDLTTQPLLVRWLMTERKQLAHSEEEALLVANCGSRLTPHQIRRYFASVRKRVRLPSVITPHSLRRTWVTQMLKAGCPIKVIADLAGHESLSTTARYAALDLAEISAVMNATHPLAGQ